jgi:hypothetical protein
MEVSPRGGRIETHDASSDNFFQFANADGLNALYVNGTSGTLDFRVHQRGRGGGGDLDFSVDANDPAVIGPFDSVRWNADDGFVQVERLSGSGGEIGVFRSVER